MGLTYVTLKVKKSRQGRKTEPVEFLVDSGAAYSVMPRTILKGLGCKPYRKRDFFLADGAKVTREIGDAYFEFQGVGGPAPVIFGEEGDSNLLGAASLEAMELVLDPFRRELRPMSLPLMGMAFGG